MAGTDDAKRPSAAPAGTITIRDAVRSDAAWLGRLHAESLPHAFLPTLGPRFMERLYVALIADPGGVVLVAEVDGMRVGMVSGVASVPAFYRRFFRRHGFRAALAAGTRLLRPSVLRRMRETSHYPDMTRKYPDAEVLTWNVVPEGRAKGLGSPLLKAVVEGLCRKGATEVKAFLYADNVAVTTVLKRTGWEYIGPIMVHDGGVPSSLWVISCHSS